MAHYNDGIVHMMNLPLAAMHFSDPVMLLGLLAAGIPVLLHLLNRVRSPIVHFPTLCFLRVTAQKTSRKRQVQQFMLLLLRIPGYIRKGGNVIDAGLSATRFN